MRVLRSGAIRGAALVASAVLALSACGTKIGTQNNCNTGADCAGRDRNGQGKTTEPPASSEPSTQQPEDYKPTPARTQAPPKPLAVGDLNFTGANWVQGTWTLNGRKYEKSLAWVQACGRNAQQVVIRLPRAYQHFTAEVGFAKGEDGQHDYKVDFDLYADRNEDGRPDDNELVASRGVTFDHPAILTTDDLRGASQIILAISVGPDCVAPPLVWGSPQVS
ncbi:NPCBM/NEW2 domain-containing protein [Streptomyces sp. NPDC056165]|uniref:NPCBM/NEW2 domain-containing protein n=1 Tax=Streptomyces sp. NPDC056165 TaxID=3345733 RepID=UPI0035E17E73